MSRRSISLLSSLLFVLLLLTPAILADGEQQFQEFARDVSDERLHAVLHDYNGAKFKHVKLAKRQSNTTTTSRNTGSTASPTRPTTTAPTTIVTTQPSQTTQSARSTTPTSENKAPTVSSATSKKTTSLTSKITRTVTGPDGVSTATDTTVVVAVATASDEPSPAPGETTSPTTNSGTPGLQNAGPRVSGRDSAIVAVLAALCFFML